MSAYVYRIFDAEDRLIYVGSSSGVEQRINGHRRTQWWGDQIARAESEEHDSMVDAIRAEKAAIAAESPRWNVQMKSTPTVAALDDLITAIMLSRNGSAPYSIIWAEKLRRRREVTAAADLWGAHGADLLSQAADLLEADRGLSAVDTLRILAARALGKTTVPVGGTLEGPPVSFSGYREWERRTA